MNTGTRQDIDPALLDLLAALDPAAARQAAGLLREVGLDAGCDVVAGDAELAVVLSGRIAVVLEDGMARARTLALLQEGEVTTVPGGGLGPGTPSALRAVVPSRVGLLDADALARWTGDPHLGIALVRMLAAQVADREAAAAIALEPRVERRLLLKLRQLAERWGRVTPGGVRLDLRLTHQELADMVGAARESITTALGRLQAQDEIEVRNRTILIRSLPPRADPPCED